MPHLIDKVIGGEAKLLGYGHRASRTADPRTSFTAQVLGDIASKHPLIKVAMEIDRVAAEDDHFVSRSSQANSDLYIGILYTAL